MNSPFLVGDIGTMMIVPEGKQYVPPGWLLCDGRCYMQDSFPELFEIYKTNRGKNDPPNSFRVPNQHPAMASNAIVQLIIRAA